MRKPETLPADGEKRFTSRADVTNLLEGIETSAAVISDALSSAIPSYDSVVVFSHEPNDPVAVPVMHVDGYDISPNRLYFRSDNITHQRVVLGGTALGDCLRDPRSTSHFAQSRINTEYQQFTHTQKLFHEAGPVGALQSSFTPLDIRRESELILPDFEIIEDIFSEKAHVAEMARIAERLFELQALSRETEAPLAADLELHDPVVPNSFIIRWDVENSTRKALGPQKAALDAYLNQVHRHIKGVTKKYRTHPDLSSYAVREAYDDQGDGAYVILPIPSGFNTYDPQVLKDYAHYITPRVMDNIASGIQGIGSQYPDLSPKVVLSGDFAYAEPNSNGRLNATTMYALADKQKQKTPH